MIDATPEKHEVRELERMIIRKKRWYARTRWVAMGIDGNGPWVEVFYSSKRRHEAMRAIEKLTEERYKVELFVLDKF
jgi:uncharacterized protein YebE (UPF0316 family)